MIPPFETTFAVPMTCESCVQDVSTSLYKLDGISTVTANLPSQLLSITGTTPPSQIVSTIQSTGRDAILRGSGKAESAAVCILETHSSHPSVNLDNAVRGLIRMVQVSAGMTLCDLTLQGVGEGRYGVSVRESGDISRGAESTGRVWGGEDAGREGGRARGWWGVVDVGKGGLGSVFVDRPVQIWEMIGRSIVVRRLREGEVEDREVRTDREDVDTLVGVIARSAGVWDNDKTVCSCSGKTVWEERKEQVGKGML
ncbi:hypothetical protein MBLNU230_g5363t1 [Neophaeotheca triangularis]